MNTLSSTASLLAHSLSWALLYSLWQALLLYCTLQAVLKALPNVNARVKYYLSYSALTGMFVWFVDTWAIQYQKLRGITIYITQGAAEGGTSTTFPVRIADTPAGPNSMFHSYLSGIERYASFILIIYILGLTFMLFRFLVNVAQLKNLRGQGLVTCDPQLTNFTGYWQDQLGIGRQVSVYLSQHVSVPMMLGAIKPVILLPFATINHLTTEQVEAILLHELAHIKRHDYLLNVVQTVMETILFFNPFIWLTSAIIRREREHCCDDIVISCAASPLPYAKALAILEHDRINNNRLALAASGQKNQLFNRIKRIMEMKKNSVNYGHLTITLVAIVAISFTVAMFTFTPSFAQQQKEDKNTTKTKTVYKSKTVTVDSNGRKKVVTHSSTQDNEGEDADDNVNINVSVTGDNDDDEGTGAKVVVSSSNGDGKRVTKKVIIKSDNDEEAIMQNIMKVVASATKEAGDAIASIDFEQIKNDIKSAQKDIDGVNWDEVNAEIHKALAEVDKELKGTNSKVNKEISEDFRRELENSKKQMEQARKDMAEAKRNMAMSRAAIAKSHRADIAQKNAEVARARAEARKAAIAPVAPVAPMAPVGPLEPMAPMGPDFEPMLNKMQQDGLINRSAKYRVEKDDNELFINGVKQPAAVYNKYSTYLKDKNVIIKGNKGTLAVTTND